MNLRSPMVNQKAIDDVNEILECIIIMPTVEQERGINNAMKLLVKDGFNMHIFNNDLSLFFRPFNRLISKEKEYSSALINRAKK